LPAWRSAPGAPRGPALSGTTACRRAPARRGA
jgi:hypothetical protein